MPEHDEGENRGPVLLILCGLPFAGKTALAVELAQTLEGAAHIEIDAINTARGLGIDAAPITPMEWSDTYRISYERIEDALAQGQDVIYDATNYSRAQRDILRATGRRKGAENAVIFVDVPVEEARRRWLANRESGELPDMPDEDFERVVNRFDPPGADELVLLFYPGMGVADLVSGIRQVFGR